jgi:hypothetical protein
MPNHVTDKDGNKVFDRMKDAVNKLEELIKNSSIPDCDPRRMIDELVRTARILAKVALADAIAAAGDPKKIADGAKRDRQGGAGNRQGALRQRDRIHFKHAWEKARDAVN